MKTVRSLVSALLAAALPVGASAQTAAPRCLTTSEAEVVFLAIGPAALKAAAGVCAGALPPRAFLLQPDAAFTARLADASQAAWPRAREAIAKIAGPELAPLLQSNALQPLVGVAVGALVVSDLKPADCVKVDRLLGLLAPLPPRNVAALGVTILQYAQDDAVRRGKRAQVPLCRTP